jgi:hypothetical protein
MLSFGRLRIANKDRLVSHHVFHPSTFLGFAFPNSYVVLFNDVAFHRSNAVKEFAAEIGVAFLVTRADFLPDCIQSVASYRVGKRHGRAARSIEESFASTIPCVCKSCFDKLCFSTFSSPELRCCFSARAWKSACKGALMCGRACDREDDQDS